MTESEIRAQIVETGRRLYARNMLAAADGNISFRLSDERILFTPSGRQKGFLKAEDLAIVSLDGGVQSGKPSGERAMHLEIYRQCPEARAVVHAHPPHAIAWTLAHPELREIPADSFSEVILGCGGLPIVPYQRPTTEAMGTALREFLPAHRALVLARHGAVCWGETLEECLNGMERLEHAAQILAVAHSLGGARPLPEDEVQALRQMRRQMGGKLL